jgi:hypothetical protein
MNTDNAWIVVLLVIAIVVLANLAMLAMVRGWRGKDSDWFGSMRGNLGGPFKKENDSLDELRKRVEELKSSKKKE